MSISISANARMVGGLFSSNFQNNSFSGGGLAGGFNYSDYASIRNGSYHKLLSSYYSLDDVRTASKSTDAVSRTGAGSTSRTYNYWTPEGKVQRTYDTSLVTSKRPVSKPESSSKDTATSKEPTSKLGAIEADAEKLSSAADALLAQGSKSLFKQVTTTDKDGNTVKGYDTDKIYKAVNSFVTQYNALTKSAGSSNVMAIRTSSDSMGYYSAQNAKKLSSIGIKFDAGTNKLSIDEEIFKNADMDTVKSLFSGSGSYAYQVSAKASQIDSHAQYEASRANTYNSVGAYSYNYSSGDLWNSMF